MNNHLHTRILYNNHFDKMCLPFYIITLEKKVEINSGLFVNLERIWYVKEKISYISNNRNSV